MSGLSIIEWAAGTLLTLGGVWTAWWAGKKSKAEAEAYDRRGEDLLPTPRLRPRPGSGEAKLPAAPEADLRRGGNLLLSVLPRWLAQRSERGE